MGVFQPRPVVERIELANQTEFDVGGLTVKPAERAVVMNGHRHDIQPRVMQVLVAMAQARPAVISRDQLVKQCWDGRIVGDDSLNRCVLALRHLAQQIAPPPFAIETVPRVGYRLVERPSANRDAERAAPPAGLPRRSRWPLIALLVTVLAAAAGWIAWQPGSAEPEPASIAVLPFRNLSGDDPHFAQGVGEEILDSLAREPQFRVAGSSSSAEAAKKSEVADIGRHLGVTYVVEGSVRRQGDRVRVNAHLVRASDNIRLWSDSYDGSLDDIFAIQRQIGAAIAGSLHRKLVGLPAVSGALATDGNAYSLYLTARGLIRTRNRRAGPMAADLLRDALQIDPGYAPAWASLGEATLLAGALKDHHSFADSAGEAQRYARHAVNLAPDLAEAHRVLGGLVGFGMPEALTHLRRGAQLAPNNAEVMLGLAAAHGAAGEFKQELAAYRRASELDPLWPRAVSALSLALAEMGDRRAAEAAVRAGVPRDAIQQHVLLGKVASVSGDHSEAVRHWTFVERANSPRWSNTARRNLEQTAFALGLANGSPTAVPRPLDQRHFERIWMGGPPELSAWQARNRNLTTGAVYRDDNHVGAKLMLNAWRSREVAAAYDGAGGSIGLRRGVPLRTDQLSEAPVVALALRHAGRRAEADRLLSRSRRLLDAVYRRGPVPYWFDAEAAALLAVQGRKDEALFRLNRAFDRGGRHGGSTDLREIGDEPAFRSLLADPRFQRLRSRLAAHRAHEREEIQRLVG